MDQFSFDFKLPESTNNDKQENVIGRKRICYPNRDQVQFSIASLEELLPADHRARDVWEYTSKLDLSHFINDIKILEHEKGRAATDPQVLLTLWIYATLEGIASARHIARLCKEHHAYIWICGGVSVNYHTISDFRTKQTKMFRKVLQESIAIMWKSGIFQPDEVAQDGTRVKANAGRNSLKRETTLSDYLEKADRLLEELQEEFSKNPSVSSTREKAAKQRAAKERKERIEKAQAEMVKHKEERIRSSKENHNKLTQEDLNNIKVSITDSDCRKMKMGDGGFRPAFNVQFATSVHRKVILGVDVGNTLDPGTLASMMSQVKESLEEIGCPMPSKWLADSAYANKKDAESARLMHPGTPLYSPPIGNQKIDAKTPRKTDNAAMADLRARMNTEEAQATYKQRSSTAEFSNAMAKNRGMHEFLVRGLEKVTCMALIYAITHNMVVYLNL